MYAFIMDSGEDIHLPTLVKVTSLLLPCEAVLTQSLEFEFGWGCPSGACAQHMY